MEYTTDPQGGFVCPRALFILDPLSTPSFPFCTLLSFTEIEFTREEQGDSN